MTEPFGLEDKIQQETKQAEKPSAPTSWWQELQKAWHAIWRPSLIVKRREQTVVQLPLAIAIVLGAAFFHVTVVLIVLALVSGYSISITTS